MAGTQLGFNNNLFTTNPNSGQVQGTILARVESVILGPVDADGNPDKYFQDNGGWASVGCITYTILGQGKKNKVKGKSKTVPIARPIDYNYKHYPIKGEIVQLVLGPSPALNDNAASRDYYYTAPYNIWNAVNHNAFPDLTEYYIETTVQTTGYGDGEKGAVHSSVSGSVPYRLGDVFEEKPYLKGLAPYEGDITLEGRWGQSIRFGSTSRSDGSLNPWSSVGEAGDPIILIRNGQGKQVVKEAWTSGIEDINNDAASIYLCAGQSIYIADLAKFKLDSFTSGRKLQEQTIQERTKQPISTDSISPNRQGQAELQHAQSSQNNIITPIASNVKVVPKSY